MVDDSAHYPDNRHGFRGLMAEFVDDPDRRGGRVWRRYGRRMMRRLAARCPRCLVADAHALRIRHMHVAYRRRAR